MSDLVLDVILQKWFHIMQHSINSCKIDMFSFQKITGALLCKKRLWVSGELILSILKVAVNGLSFLEF